MEQFSIMRYEVAMKWARVVPENHGMEVLMIALK